MIDLLDFSSNKEKIMLREVENGAILVQGMKIHAVQSVDDVAKYLEMAI